MIPIVTPAEMAAIDRQAPEPLDVLIDRAAGRVAWAARKMLGGVYGRRVIVIAGPGNNGADARVAAAKLERLGVRTQVVSPSASAVPHADLVIDGAFGTGMNRPYAAPPLPPGVPVLAVDIPSGVDGLTGELGGDVAAADRTITFAALKPGLLLLPGATLAGAVQVSDIGLDTSGAAAWLMSESEVRQLLPVRRTEAHKWKQSVWVIGGSTGMTGAPTLASTAALRSGAGIVWCSIPGEVPPNTGSEIVFAELAGHGWDRQVLDSAGGPNSRFGALVVGCGIGRSTATRQAVRSLVAGCSLPMVIDGDALRLLGDRPTLDVRHVLTPHDGEFEALMGHRPQPDRFEAARELSARTGATVVLKGPLTIVAEPGGQCVAANRGDQRLATAGTGDVLAGIVGAFLAAGLDPPQAGALAAWVHGDAGLSQTPFGMVASDLLTGIATTLTRLTGDPQSTSHGGSHASN